MSLIKTGSATLGSKLKGALRAKYGIGGALPDTSCLLLDISGSMAGWKLEKLRELAAEFNDVRRFQSSSGCDELSPGEPVSDAQGGTSLHAGFLKIKSRGVNHCVLITDGQPDSETLALQTAAGLKVDVFYVGPDPAPDFLKRLAGATGGQYGAASMERVRELTASVRARLAIEAPKQAIAL